MNCAFLPPLFDTGFPEGHAEGRSAGGGFSTSAGETSVELDDAAAVNG